MDVLDKLRKKKQVEITGDIAENEGKKRELTGPWKIAVSVLCISLAVFQLFCAGVGLIDDSVIMSVHLAFVLALIFLLFPAGRRSKSSSPTAVDVILAVAGFLVAMYVTVFSEQIHRQMGIPTNRDIVFGAIAVVLILEAARRAIGKAMPLVAIGFIIFALVGRYIPGTFRHAGFTVRKIVKLLYLTDEGIFGTALNTSATYVILFIFFGSIMSEIGMSKFLNNFALSLAGGTVGGPAKVSAIASGLMGTVSGSTSGNVATTGVMTIPLMKSVGYKAEYAGAVECVASAGGQIMPPVMGAAAFLMAQFIGVDYSVIVIAAIIPAVLYYFGVIVAVHLRAQNQGLRTLEKDQIPKLGDTIREYGHMAIPLLALIYFLAIRGFSPIYSAWLAILLAIAISFLKKNSRLSLKRFLAALENGVKGTLSVAIACACAGLVIGVISLTGFGLVFANNIFKLSGGHLLIALIMAMIASVVLGMGLPTTACYIVTSLTLAPALVNMGVTVLAAHFFVFYFAIMSTITPPVALSSFVAAGIAQADPIKTGFSAFRLAVAGFILPFMLIYKPALLVQGFGAAQILYNLGIAVAGIFLLAVVSEGYFRSRLRVWERIILFGCAAGLLIFGTAGDMIALPAAAVLLVLQYIKGKKRELPA